MPTLPISAIPPISPVRDPLLVAFQDAAALASANEEITLIEVLIEVEDVFNSNQWRRVGELLNPYGADDTASVLIHRVLMGVLKGTVPDFTTTTAQSIEGLIKKYRLLARDVIGGDPAGAFTTTATAHSWLAGSEYPDYGIDLDGKAYLFLTTKPLNRHFHPLEKIVLYMLPLVGGVATLQAIITFTDGTTQSDTTKNFGTVEIYRPKYLVYTIPEVAKTIAKIEFDITGLAGTAEKLTYKLISRPSPYFRQLIYLNSLGGFDSVPLIGKTQESETFTGDAFEAQQFPGTDSAEGNFKTFNQRSNKEFVLRTGWITKLQRDALSDMMLINQVYLLEGTKLRKILISNASHQISQDGQFLYSLEIQARFTHDQSAYSRK